jgi:HlyD family secretion protein
MSDVQTATPQRAEQQKQPSSAPAPPLQPKQASARKRFAPLVVLLLLLVTGIAVWKIFFSQPPLPDNIVALSGRIEGDDSAVSPKTTGRILQIRYREGDSAKAGDVIAILDDQQVRAREEQAQAAVLQADASLRSAQQQISVLQEQLQQADLQTDQSKVDAEGRVRQAEAELAAAEADYTQQQKSLELALFDRDAYTRLARNGAVSERQGKQAATTAAAQEAVVAATQRRVESARGALNIAKSSLANPAIRNAASAAIRRQITQQQAQIASAAADAARAKAQLVEAQANRRDLIVTAPFDGTIVTRTAEPGEVVQAGTAVVTMLDLSKVYLRGFVPEGQIGNVKIGQSAHVYLDSNPSHPLDAYVSRIDPEATFTPENTYFRNDRVKQVVGVKLQLKAGIGYAKPGMPADGEILVSGDTWPPERQHK